MSTTETHADGVHATLQQIATDRQQPSKDRALARDILALLPVLLSLRERGYGELLATYHDGKIVAVEETRKWQVKEA